MEAKATDNTTPPTTILLIIPGKIGLTLSINQTKGGATVTKIDPTSRFKDKFQEGDRIMTIDGFRITKIADLHVNSDKVRRFGVVQKNPVSTTTVASNNPPAVAAAAVESTTTIKSASVPVPPVVPPLAAPKRKAATKAAPKEKRLKRFRSYPTNKIQERIDRALHQRLFLIESSAPLTCPHHGGPSIKCSVLGSTGNVYEVTIAKVPRCSCPDAAKGNLCKHLLFVMLKVVGLPANHHLVYQSAYLTEELDQIVTALQTRLERLGRDVVANEEVQKFHADLKKGIKCDEDGDNAVSRKDVDGEDCPICFDELGSNLSQLTYCKGTCGTNFHKSCIQMWTRQSAHKSAGPTCPACRQQWEDVETGGKKAGGGSPSRSEGYDNLGRLQGQSTVRDTSSYHSPYDGYKRRRYY
eukprot:scaffold39073_cov186-Skeletonema_marinoi.AAC.4